MTYQQLYESMIISPEKEKKARAIVKQILL